MAVEKHAEGNYSRAQLRSDIAEICAETPADQLNKRRAKSLQRTLPLAQDQTVSEKVRFSADEHDALLQAAFNAHCDPAEFVRRMVRQGCLLLSARSLERLDGQMVLAGISGVERRTEYLERLLCLAEKGYARKSNVLQTQITSAGASGAVASQ